MAKSHKTCMAQAKIIDTFGTYHWSAVAVDVGAQEQEIPDDDHHNVKIHDAIYDVEFPLDREQFGGSQAGSLAFSIISCLC